MVGSKDILLGRIRNGGTLTGGQQLKLCLMLSYPAILAQLSFVMMQYIDTSMVGHLGAAAGARGVTVFGPTDWTATGPISPLWSLLSDPPACAPCFRHECPRGHECMKAVTPAQVMAEMNALLKKCHITLPPPGRTS